MIATESVGRYYVGWRSRVLLVAKDQIRMATMEEAAASDTIAKDMALTADKKHYQDMTGEPTPPPPPPVETEGERGTTGTSHAAFERHAGGGEGT